MALKRLLAYTLRYKRNLVLASIFSMISAVAGVFAPLVAKQAVDLVVSFRFEEVVLYAGLFVFLSVIRGVSSFIQSVESRKLAEYISFDLRVELYRKLQDLSLIYLYRKGVGKLVARATGDIERIKGFFGFTLSGFMGGLVLVIFSVGSMLSIDPLLAVVSLSVLAPLPFLIKRFAGKVRFYFRNAREEYAKMATVLRETLVSMVPIRAVGAVEYMAGKFAGFNSEYADSMISIGRIRALAWPTFGFFTNLAVLLVFWYGGLKVIGEELSIGDVVAFTMYVSMISWPITSIGILTVIAERARVAASRVFEVLDEKEDVEEDPNASPLKVERGEVIFDDVWFSYNEEKWVLKGLNLRIKPGEFIAITGAPGSGKSTLAMLLIRLADPQKGRILIDGQDIRKVTVESLRRQVTLVHQDIYLFPDTIRNNIAYAKPDASMEEIVKVAKLAGIHDFIAELPKGYDTLIGERGITVSGGQRQRLALARALLIDPKIVVLDDTTSEIDAETERAIYDALTKHLRGKTLIVITQRPATMALADRVVVLEDGKVVKEIRKGEAVVEGVF